MCTGGHTRQPSQSCATPPGAPPAVQVIKSEGGLGYMVEVDVLVPTWVLAALGVLVLILAAALFAWLGL